ncbi:MAG: hypothetical protein RM368_05755 [Nostoc sp. DedSLP03]|uniref:DUF6888 family protein n=1 Tax=Nostoc sp. DedSLP03 TaxID=3075400 RepID=UPI002AD5601A|nr:hypothetical protein [Nostoc sp. DedSLP03]MDZ7964465.1 hypothetical protein [Nostoc sp. DedSLP03]
MEPTPKQAISAIRVCAQLTRVYKGIDLVRLDERTKNVYILANNSIEAKVLLTGEILWL